MSEPPQTRSEASRPAVDDEPCDRPKRMLLDGRRPWLLDGRGRAMQVAAGHVDLFSVGRSDRSGDGARRHMFRAEIGELILDLPVAGDDVSGCVQVIAVGGPGSEAWVLPRGRLEDMEQIATWIARISEVIVGYGVDWSIREIEPEATCEIEPGERRRGPARGIAWVSVVAGGVRLMGLDPVHPAGSQVLPLTSGMWIEAGKQGAKLTCTGRAPDGADLWSAIDQFHVGAMASLHGRVAADVEREAQRLLRRNELAGAHTHELFDELSTVMGRQSERVRLASDATDSLLGACRAVADAMRATIVRPSERTPARQEFSDVVEIARASRLRVRRTLLRGSWWRRDVGPLVAWRGEARDPVALIPASRHRYLMFDPRTGTRRVVDETVTSDLAVEAATFYSTLPARPLSFWSLLAFSMRHARGNAVRILLGGLALGLLSVVAPLITQVLVDSVIPRTELDQLAYCAAALAMTAIAMAGLQMMQAVAMLRLEGLLDWKLQAALVDRLLRLPASVFREHTVGDLADRALGIDAIRRIVTGRTLRGLLAGIFCCFSLIVMFYYDSRLALVATTLTIVRGLLIIGIGAVRLYHEQRYFNLQGKVQGLVLQLFAGVGKLRVAAATIRGLGVWAKRYAAQKRHFISSQRTANVLNVVEAAFPTVATLIIFAAAEESSGVKLTLDLGAFLAFFAAFGQSLAAIGEWAAAIGGSLIAIPYFSRIRPLIAGAAEISEDRRPPGELSGSVELSRVTFRYVSGGPPILDNLTLRVAPGEYVAVVGPSGSGKSTIFRLLLGFERPDAGAVFFDGKAIDTLDLSAVRRQMGVVLQNGRLSSGSIYDNICGGVQLPLGQVWDAARLAGLEADINAMPMGMHTVIAEGVSTLSGGQRQRLMIARAIVRRPRILLFDEATSSLDNQAQAIVSGSLARLNVTRIVIAHRLNTVRQADRIVVLVDGKVVQAGTFAELSGAPGVFADFARRQLL
jgi:NHLM bacteriocin system ABC transporter ATP-binding protein